MLTQVRPTRRRTQFSAIGLDIGHSAVRAVQMRRRPAGDVPGDAGAHWSVVDAVQWESRSQAESLAAESSGTRLARGFRQRVFHGRRVVIGLSPPDVEVHALELSSNPDGADDAALAAAARVEIERLMSFQAGAAECDFWRIPPGRGGRITALGVAACHERVLGAWELCRKMGVDCRRIDASPCAVARVGALLPLAGRGRIWGALDLGRRSARLMLCADEVPVLVRVLEAGGQRWSERIAEGLQLTPDSAERHKRDHGIAWTRRGARRAQRGAEPSREAAPSAALAAAGPSDELGGMIMAVLRTDLEQLTVELERSYAYVLQCFPDRSAGGLMLVGGGAALRNLSRYLSDKLGIDVRDVDGWMAAGGPLRWVGQHGQPASLFATAIGLALAD